MITKYYEYDIIIDAALFVQIIIFLLYPMD